MHDYDQELRKLFDGAASVDQERFEQIRKTVRLEFDRKKKKLVLLFVLGQLMAFLFMAWGALLLMNGETARGLHFGTCLMIAGFAILMIHVTSFVQNTTHLDVLKAVQELRLSLGCKEQHDRNDLDTTEEGTCHE